ncbi:unnamed protein product [Paramecium sonneborni]|uniref:Transmembrane protein n=1 Tax=Paramecium sonneborni TaxID=65129 RepID=A0A8S1PME0_9CILI|nr:unnamed protein product [Paramecium sonneborni]
MNKIDDEHQMIIRQIQGVSFASEMHDRDEKQIHKDLVRIIVKEDKKLKAKKTLFSLANTILIVLSIYNMISLVNIEAYHSFIYYEELQQNPNNFGILYYLVILDIIHFLRIVNCCNGIFGAELKSQKIVTFYLIFSSFLFVSRSVLTIITIISYSQIHTLCSQFFTEQDADVLALNYCLVMASFLFLDALFTMICIVQGSNNRENQQISNELKQKIQKKYFICYENALNSFF